jgi:hypothetical protein
MRKRITLLIAALMLALSMSFGGVAFAGGHHGCAKHSQGWKASHHKYTAVIKTVEPLHGSRSGPRIRGRLGR